MDLRGKLFASKNRRFTDEQITLGDDEVVAVRIRQPSVGDRKRIAEAAQRAKNEDLAASVKAQWLAIRLCCFDPETDKPLFSETDESELFGQTSIFDQLWPLCFKTLDPTTAVRKEEIAGNSEATRSES